MIITPILVRSEQQLSVYIEDNCNHAGAVTKEIEFVAESYWEDAHMSVPDDSELIEVEVCTCGFYKDPYTGLWESLE